MRLADASIGKPRVVVLAEDEGAHAAVASSWLMFDSRKGECFDPADKVRILAVIECFPGGAVAFNSCIRQLATELLGDICKDNASASRPLHVEHVALSHEEANGLGRDDGRLRWDRDGLGDFCLAV